MKHLRFDEEAEAAFLEAADFYEADNPAVARRFVRAVFAAIDIVHQAPHGWPLSPDVPEHLDGPTGHFEWTVVGSTAAISVLFYPDVTFFSARFDLGSVPVLGLASLPSTPEEAVVTVLIGDCAGAANVSTGDGPGTKICLAPASSTDCISEFPPNYGGLIASGTPSGARTSGSIASFTVNQAGAYTAVARGPDGHILVKSQTTIEARLGAATMVFINYPVPEY